MKIFVYKTLIVFLSIICCTHIIYHNYIPKRINIEISNGLCDFKISHHGHILH